MSEYGFSIKRNENIDVVQVGTNRVFGHTYRKIAVFTFNVRIIFPISEDVEPTLKTSSGENICCRVDAATLGAAYHPS
jgi:hypothetical protein